MTVPPRLAPLLTQYDFALDRLVDRIGGLLDDEYQWEPVTNCWNVRPRQNVQTTQSVGRGPWVMDIERPASDPPPFTTIAWRMCHLAIGLTMRADYTIGSRSLAEDDLEIPATSTDGVGMLMRSGASWRKVLTTATDADLDQVGRSQFPWGLDPELPLLDIVWWVNQEVLHHGAEIALLRDLYRARTVEDARGSWGHSS